MNQEYTFEPAGLEVIMTECVGNTLMRGYYSDLVNSLGIQGSDKVLDYCSGSGIISKKIAKKLKDGQLIFADVSNVWLEHASKKLKAYKAAKAVRLNCFGGKLEDGEYDKILVHYAIHDFPQKYRIEIINQLADNLKGDGILYLREPLGEKHGFKLHELVNLIESIKRLSYEYEIVKKPLIGEFINVKCHLK